MLRIKKKTAVLTAVACLFLTGCDGAGPLGVDGLLSAPKFTDEQSVIHRTLEKSVGKNISLKYPENGYNRSAFLIEDIDGEPTDEALVFYEKNNASSGDSGVRINVMDKTEDGEWKSVFDLAGKGTDIDIAAVSELGDDGVKNIIIGYSAMTMDTKTLQISRYENGTFTPGVFEDTYSIMEILDIDKDGSKEIVTAFNNTSAAAAEASVIQSINGEIVKDYTTSMASDTVSFAGSTIGLVDEETPAVFVDCLKSTGELQTEILYFKYGRLQNPLLQISELLSQTSRPAGYYCMDIDGDGVVEIPVTQVMTGYENLDAGEQVLMTSWLTYNDFYSLEKKYSGYYSISDGYQMVFPTRWQGVVTVKTDASTNEAVFYRYDGDINGYMTELMRIAVCPKNETEDYVYEGYEVIGSNGQLDYLVKLATNRKEPLIPTIDEVKNSFFIV